MDYRAGLTAIGALAVVAAVAVGIIGLTQAMTSSRRADRAFVVTYALAATVDAQHTGPSSWPTPPCWPRRWARPRTATWSTR